MIKAFLPTSPDASILVDLMVRYQAADLSAADELVRRLSPLLFRFLSHPAYTRSHNEDLLQECWLQIHQARHTYRPDSPLLPWMFAIARYVRCKAYHHRFRIQSHELPADALPETSRAPWPQAGSRHEHLLWALELLPESQRKVLLLQKVSGMSLAEIAQATSCSIGAVKQKAHRAYKSLRKLYSQQARQKPPDGATLN